MLYLAMTAGEFRTCQALPPHMAWMACHFSAYGTGLTDLPPALPPGSLLILNDRMPINGHDPELILQTLRRVIEENRCTGLLLDLQQERTAEADELVRTLLALPCPVAVSEAYAPEDGVLFLPPVPLLTPLDAYLQPWQGRQIWLEAAGDGLQITLTEKGSTAIALPLQDPDALPHFDAELHLHYDLSLTEHSAVFTLGRTGADLAALLEEAKTHGVSNAAGLYQELGGIIGLP